MSTALWIVLGLFALELAIIGILSIFFIPSSLNFLPLPIICLIGMTTGIPGVIIGFIVLGLITTIWWGIEAMKGEMKPLEGNMKQKEKNWV